MKKFLCCLELDILGESTVRMQFELGSMLKKKDKKKEKKT